jgi:putative restriction endonuclease
MMPITQQILSKYLVRFSELHRNHKKDVGSAPHKPILLLALIDEIDRGTITRNLIPITPELVATFRAYWRTLVPPGTWQERMVYPFRYLIQDGFWELIKDGTPLVPKQLGDPTSLNQLSSIIDGGRFSDDLWSFLQDEEYRRVLKSHLLRTFFNSNENAISLELPANPINYEIEKLVKEAQSKFRLNMVRERRDDNGYYVRHALFPRVVKSLYQEACSVCSLKASLSGGSGIVDAAHIMPFREFHNDDPRNGIALCKNHHWGFDAGWYSLTDEYVILVSSKLISSSAYVNASKIQLPHDIEYAPALEALKWHRSTVFNP